MDNFFGIMDGLLKSRQKDLFAPKRQDEDGEYLLPELDLLTPASFVITVGGTN